MLADSQVLILLLFLLSPFQGEAEAMLRGNKTRLSDEKRLIVDLLDRYSEISVYGRPVTNRSMTLNVGYGMGLLQIIELDKGKEVLTIKAWERYSWRDMFLKWDPSKYSGIGTIRLPASRIWKPDIVLYNSADAVQTEYGDAMAVVQSTGEVLWIPQRIMKSTCSINDGSDEQTCSLKFGSWTYDGYHIDVNFFDGRKEIDMNDYVPSHKWDIIEAAAVKNVKRYPCCNEPYPDLTFSLRLKERRRDRIGAATV